MGSLMAGWNSTRLGKSFERSSSFTRDEINHFWKEQRLSDEERAKRIAETASSSSSSQKDDIFATDLAASVAQVQRWNSFDGESETKPEPQIIQKNDWWRRTNYAFLNDRPDESANTRRNKDSDKFLVQNPVGKMSRYSNSTLTYSKSLPSSSSNFPPSTSLF